MPPYQVFAARQHHGGGGRCHGGGAGYDAGHIRHLRLCPGRQCLCPPHSDKRRAVDGIDGNVVGACDYSPMKLLKGIELRYVLTWHLAIHGPATITELANALEWHGFYVRGRVSKAVSDALRWEIGRDRVRRRGRGRYGAGYLPRSTEYRIHQRVMALREEASRCVVGTRGAARAGDA